MRGVWLDNATLSGADLSGADMSFTSGLDANFSGANLSAADLDNADLTGAKQSHAGLGGAHIGNADFHTSDLRECLTSARTVRWRVPAVPAVACTPSPSDLADAEWAVIAPLLPPPSRTGRPEAHARRDILDAIFSQLRQGGAWRGLPHDLPPWQTVYWRFRRWIRDGTCERVTATLRERGWARWGRHPQPTAAIIDSQSVWTAAKGYPRPRRR